MKRSRFCFAIVTIIALAITTPGCGGGGGGANNTVDPNAHIYTGTYKLDSDTGVGTIVVNSDGTMTLRTLDDYGKTMTLSGAMTELGSMNVSGKDSKGDGLRMWASFSKDHYGIWTNKVSFRFDDETNTTHVINEYMMFYKQ